MTIIRYSDADRERMRREQREWQQWCRRQDLFHEFLREHHPRPAPSRVMPGWSARVANLQIDPNGRKRDR